MAKEGKSEGVKGRVCQKSVAMLGVSTKVKSFLWEGAKGVTPNDVVEEK